MVRGCGRNAQAVDGYRHVTVLGQVFDRCPKAWARDEAQREIEVLRQADALQRWGALPCAGGLDDQPAAFVAALDVIDDEARATQDALRRVEEARKRGS